MSIFRDQPFLALAKAIFVLATIAHLTIPASHLAISGQEQKQPIPPETLKIASDLRRLADRIEGLEQERRYSEAVQSGVLEFPETNQHPRFRFVYVSAGRVVLGMTEAQRQANITRFAQTSPHISTTLGFDSSPQISFSMNRGFFILDQEVTRSQYFGIMQSAQLHPPPEPPKADPDNQPIVAISWRDSMAFCSRLEATTGYAVRLPTEIEWEYAARGPFPQSYPWFEEFVLLPDGNYRLESKPQAWVAPNSKTSRPLDRANSADLSWCGAYEMAGNVSEWCLDVYDRTAYARYAAIKRDYDPHGVPPQLEKPSNATGRVYRGGNFADSVVSSHVALRRDLSEQEKDPRIGFRPVLFRQRNSSESQQGAKE